MGNKPLIFSELRPIRRGRASRRLDRPRRLRSAFKRGVKLCCVSIIAAMSEMSDTFRAVRLARLQDLQAQRRRMLKDYFSAISGSGGRLVFSLIYFIALANALSIPDFGLFATASAA